MTPKTSRLEGPARFAQDLSQSNRPDLETAKTSKEQNSGSRAILTSPGVPQGFSACGKTPGQVWKGLADLTPVRSLRFFVSEAEPRVLRNKTGLALTTPKIRSWPILGNAIQILHILEPFCAPNPNMQAQSTNSG